MFVCAIICGGIYGLMSGLGLPLIFEKVFKNIFEHPEDYHLINDLVSLQKSKTILMNNNGLQGDIEKRLDNYLNQQ